MPGLITVQLNTKSLTTRLANLSANAPAATARALNRAIVSAQAVLARETAADLGLKVGDVKAAMSIGQASATAGKQVATISAEVARIPLIAFNARGPEPSRGKGAGVTARVPGGAGSYPHAFIATMRSGHRGVFQRATGAGRTPVRELRGPSISHVAAKHTAAALAAGEESLIKNLQSELRYAMTRSLAA